MRSNKKKKNLEDSAFIKVEPVLLQLLPYFIYTSISSVLLQTIIFKSFMKTP